MSFLRTLKNKRAPEFKSGKYFTVLHQQQHGHKIPRPFKSKTGATRTGKKQRRSGAGHCDR
jgi:hypothetical protein